MTVDCLLENVPKEVPGIVFLSGGQSNELATAHLNEMNKLSNNLPWELSFSMVVRSNNHHSNYGMGKRKM